MKIFTIKDALLTGSKILQNAGLKKPLRDSRILLSFALKIDKSELMVKLEKKLNFKEKKSWEKLIKRRAKFEPIQYITGIQFFYNTEVKVGKGCLIPRAETEFLVEETLKITSNIDSPVIADLGSGSGAILKAFGKEIKSCLLLGIDNNLDALYWSKENLKDEKKCLLISGDYENETFLKNIDVIVCNPPYITKREYKKLTLEIKLYEPKSSLITDETFYFYEKATRFAEKSLKSGGFLLFEIGSEQAKRWKHFQKISPFFIIHKRIKDYGGKLRVVVLKKIDNHCCRG